MMQVCAQHFSFTAIFILSHITRADGFRYSPTYQSSMQYASNAAASVPDSGRVYHRTELKIHAVQRSEKLK